MTRSNRIFRVARILGVAGVTWVVAGCGKANSNFSTSLAGVWQGACKNITAASDSSRLSESYRLTVAAVQADGHATYQMEVSTYVGSSTCAGTSSTRLIDNGTLLIGTTSSNGDTIISDLDLSSVRGFAPWSVAAGATLYTRFGINQNTLSIALSRSSLSDDGTAGDRRINLVQRSEDSAYDWTHDMDIFVRVQ